MKRSWEPEWSSEQIGIVRRIYRTTGDIDEAMRALDTKMSKDGFRRRALQIGIRFDKRPSIHAGTSVMSRGKEDAA